jgi:rhamnopyranosyl-N-acetylglucosaminyl-diphospho-decaprenol beta-1,3/1,4-galactofuranosyltransferase
MSDKVLNVIVTYNRLNDLKVCVEKVRAQTYKNFDILVVNNGSTDGTTEYLAEQTDIKVLIKIILVVLEASMLV